MNAKELNRCLEDVLLDDRFSSPLRKAKLIISLCSYYSYSSETENSEINHELEKLSSMIINYAVLEDLIKTLNELIDKRVHWQPHQSSFQRVDLQIALNKNSYFSCREIRLQEFRLCLANL